MPRGAAAGARSLGAPAARASRVPQRRSALRSSPVQRDRARARRHQGAGRFRARRARRDPAQPRRSILKVAAASDAARRASATRTRCSLSAAQLADSAATIRREAALTGDMARAWNASSAAAGALMLSAPRAIETASRVPPAATATVITPRRTRLVRVPDLHDLPPRDRRARAPRARPPQDSAVVVPTRAAAHACLAETLASAADGSFARRSS